MIAYLQNGPNIGAAWVKPGKPLSRESYLNALGNRLQELIDRIPDEEEPQLRELVDNYLGSWDLVPTYSQKEVLGHGLVEALADSGFIRWKQQDKPPQPNEAAKKVLLQDRVGNPLERLEWWLNKVLPSEEGGCKGG